MCRCWVFGKQPSQAKRRCFSMAGNSGRPTQRSRNDAEVCLFRNWAVVCHNRSVVCHLPMVPFHGRFLCPRRSTSFVRLSNLNRADFSSNIFSIAWWNWTGKFLSWFFKSECMLRELYSQSDQFLSQIILNFKKVNLVGYLVENYQSLISCLGVWKYELRYK